MEWLLGALLAPIISGATNKLFGGGQGPVTPGSVSQPAGGANPNLMALLAQTQQSQAAAGEQKKAVQQQSLMDLLRQMAGGGMA